MLAENIDQELILAAILLRILSPSLAGILTHRVTMNVFVMWTLRILTTSILLF